MLPYLYGTLTMVNPAANMTWTCHVCGDDRPDELIDVMTTSKVSPNGVVFEQNVRYCKDRIQCEAGAIAVDFTEDTTKFLDSLTTDVDQLTVESERKAKILFEALDAARMSKTPREWQTKAARIVILAAASWFVIAVAVRFVIIR